MSGQGGDLTQPHAGPTRPSHFRQEVNERAAYDSPPHDYASESDTPVAVHGFPPPPQPTPVYLTEPPPRARVIVNWRPDTFTVDNTATNVNASRTRIASVDRHRKRFVVRNLDAANSVFITNDALNNNQSFAYELPFGTREEFFHTGEMYAFCATTKSAKIAVFAEVELDEFHE